MKFRLEIDLKDKRFRCQERPELLNVADTLAVASVLKRVADKGLPNGWICDTDDSESMQNMPDNTIWEIVE